MQEKQITEPIFPDIPSEIENGWTGSHSMTKQTTYTYQILKSLSHANTEVDIRSSLYLQIQLALAAYRRLI